MHTFHGSSPHPSHRPTQLSHTHPTRDSKRRQACNPAYSERYHDHIRAPSRIQSPPSKFRRSLDDESKTLRTPHTTLSVCTDAGPESTARIQPRQARKGIHVGREACADVGEATHRCRPNEHHSLHEAHAYKSQLTLQRFMRANPNLRAKESHLMGTRKLWHA